MDFATLLKGEIEKKKKQLESEGIAQEQQINREQVAQKERETEQPIQNEEAPVEDAKKEDENVLERIKTRPERIRKIQECDSKIDTTIDPNSIGEQGQTYQLPMQCNLYIHSLLADWEKSSYQPDLLFETKKSLFPLLVKLRKNQLSSELIISLSTILYHIQKHEYTRATESYMKLSIGNVAWPIGVTSIGIHARSAHEKITGSNKIANVMLDDITRLWITSIKRLITFQEFVSRKH